MFITGGTFIKHRAPPRRFKPHLGLRASVSHPPSLGGVSSIFTPSVFTHRPPPLSFLCSRLPPFPLLPLPRLWCPWGPAEAPIKPAVNGSNPVINGCVLQTRVWGCCSHGFIRWNGIGTHMHRHTHTLSHGCNRSCIHALSYTRSFIQLQMESYLLQLCCFYGCHARAAPRLPLND